jgi:uncharacterized metal-binding protein
MMYCTAGLGGRVPGILATTGAAAKILVIDGCPLNCAKLSLGNAGFSAFEHLQLADLGMGKGATEVSAENVEKVMAAAAEKLSC